MNQREIDPWGFDTITNASFYAQAIGNPNDHQPLAWTNVGADGTLDPSIGNAVGDGVGKTLFIITLGVSAAIFLGLFVMRGR